MIPKALFSVLLCILILSSGCTALQKIQEPAPTGVGYSTDSNRIVGESAAPPLQKADSAPVQTDKSTGSGTASLSPSDQKIIKSADLQIEVSDVRKTAETIGNIASSKDGVVQSSSVTLGREDQYSGVVTIRIPSQRFDESLKEVQNLGKITSSSVSAQDVTEEYVDLDAQKTALTNQLSQYNRILGQAVNVSEILEVQREIERIQVELDRITGKMKYLDNRVSFSVITIRLSEPAQVVTSTGYSVASVISEGIAGFSGTVVWLVIVVMTLLPLIILGTVGYLLYRRWKIHRTE